MPDRDDPPVTKRTLPRAPTAAPRPNVMGARLSQPDPPEEPTRPDLPTARQRLRQPTQRGLPAPLPRGAAPAPPPSGDTTLQSAPSEETTPVSGHGQPPRQDARRESRPEPRMTRPGLGPSLPRSQQEPVRRDSPSPEESTWSEKFGSPGAPSPSLVAKAEKIPLARWLVLIGATGATLTGIITATGQVVVNILQASRPASIQQLRDELEPKLKAVQARADADWGLKPETEARLAQERKADEAAAKLDARIKALEEKLPRIQGLPPVK